jgi:hypothetical protein
LRNRHRKGSALPIERPGRLIVMRGSFMHFVDLHQCTLLIKTSPRRA